MFHAKDRNKSRECQRLLRHCLHNRRGLFRTNSLYNTHNNIDSRNGISTPLLFSFSFSFLFYGLKLTRCCKRKNHKNERTKRERALKRKKRKTHRLELAKWPLPTRPYNSGKLPFLFARFSVPFIASCAHCRSASVSPVAIVQPPQKKPVAPSRLQASRVRKYNTHDFPKSIHSLSIHTRTLLIYSRSGKVAVRLPHRLPHRLRSR